MLLRTKTSADIFYRNIVLAVLLMAVFIMVSCSSGRYQSRYYEPMKPGDYKEEEPTRRTGMASWYGPGFHGKLTASGEPYDMNAMTCAHKTFPMGTKLKVTNLANKKSVFVTVNDRGPYVHGREIDLSYAAAKELEMIGPGTARVEIEPLGRDVRYVAYDKSYSIEKGPFTVQVASFVDRNNALELLRKLEHRYERRSPYIFEANDRGKRFYRVRVGKFNSREEAQSLADALIDDGFGVLVCTHEDQI